MKKTLEQMKTVTAEINTEVLAQLHGVPTRTIEAPEMCACCARTAVPEKGDLCYSCDDLFDISDEERYDDEQEELENMSWLADMEEEMTARTANPPTPCQEVDVDEIGDFFESLRAPQDNNPTVPTDGGLGTVPAPGRRSSPDAPATESEKIRFLHISMDVEDQQHQLAELERRHMYLRVHAQDSLDYQEALLDTVAEIESTKEYLVFIEAQRRDLMPEYFAR